MTVAPSNPQTRAASPTIARVLAGETCAGCGLCAGISNGAISMAIDDKGFARPDVRGAVALQVEAAIAAACPGAVVAPWPTNFEGDVHPYWGPYLQCNTGHATDDEVRFAGSSGGLLSALAIHALESGLVDAIVHVRGSEIQPIANEVTVSRDRAAVLAAAGSRYGPSAALVQLGQLLSLDERYLIIGKPCDISALRQFGTVDDRVGRAFPFMLSFFCGGLPSVHGTEAIVRALGFAPEELTAFRYRGMGWPGTASATDASGRSATMSYEQSWGDFLSGRVQYRCKICPDAVGGTADIAGADAWYGGESGYPKFDQRDGRSLAMVRSAAGEALLQSALAAGKCIVAPLPIAEVDLMQPAQARRKRLVRARLLAARVMRQPVPTMTGLQIERAAQAASVKDQVKNLLGSVKRIWSGNR
jgi:coenzyme F420 hydrogenase subunit beta